MSRYYSGFPEYVSVAKRKEKREKFLNRKSTKRDTFNPITVEGRLIARTFWGKAWCSHLESFDDYESRLTKGRSYVRNGSVIDLKIKAGEINALVFGTSLYKVTINVVPLFEAQWQALIKECNQQIDSLVELLQGKFSDGVIAILTQKNKGMFPSFDDMDIRCSCPDYSYLCKHAAAVLYGVGNRLDQAPELLFLLRSATHLDLIKAPSFENVVNTNQTELKEDLSTLFDIDLVT